jgi:hypothetical protein
VHGSSKLSQLKLWLGLSRDRPGILYFWKRNSMMELVLFGFIMFLIGIILIGEFNVSRTK